MAFSSLAKFDHILRITSYVSWHNIYMVLDPFWQMKTPTMTKFREIFKLFILNRLNPKQALWGIPRCPKKAPTI